MNQSQSQTFRIGLSQNLLDKAEQFFNSTLDDILIELLQNARRAKATKIDIFYIEEPENRYLVVRDNGQGIFKEEVSLSLGGSHWSDETQKSETPAGCGLFSLSGRGCTIESCGKKISLTPVQFKGREDVAIDMGENISGTRVSFPISVNEADGLDRILSRRVLHYPIPVFLNGKKLEQKDFLADAVYKEPWNDLEIGVVATNWYTSINFYGLLVNAHLPKIAIFPQEVFSVYAQVIDCPDLKLVLPARKEIVQDGFYETFLEQCWRVIFRYVATLGCHRLAYGYWKKATSLGIVLPPVEPMLNAYLPDWAHEDDKPIAPECQVDEKAVIVRVDYEPPMTQIWMRGQAKAKLDYQLCKLNYDYEGYSWYDRLPVLSDMKIEVEYNNEILALNDAVGRWGQCQFDRIWLIATLDSGQNNTRQIRLETDVAFWSIDWTTNDLDEVTIALSNNASLGVEELVELLQSSYYSPSDDSDADSWTTQREAFQLEATSKAISLLLGEEEARIHRIEAIANKELYWLIPQGKTLQITRGSNLQLSVKFT